jgi:hypothetical protein
MKEIKKIKKMKEIKKTVLILLFAAVPFLLNAAQGDEPEGKNKKIDKTEVTLTFNDEEINLENAINKLADEIFLFAIESLNEPEEEIEIEDWMLEPLYFESEEEIKIEDWMLEPLYFESEEEIEIEDWMLEPLYFESEEEVEIENWMLEPLYPEEDELQIEDWMLSELKTSK